MQQQKRLTHLPQSQNCQGIFPVLDTGADLGFSLRGLLLVKTKKGVPDEAAHLSKGVGVLPWEI